MPRHRTTRRRDLAFTRVVAGLRLIFLVVIVASTLGCLAGALCNVQGIDGLGFWIACPAEFAGATTNGIPDAPAIGSIVRDWRAPGSSGAPLQYERRSARPTAVRSACGPPRRWRRGPRRS